MQRGYQLSADDRLRRDVIISLMCHGRIDYAAVERKHGINFREYFADSLAQLAEHVADGLVELRDDALILLPQGQLMMRNVAMAFDAYLGGEQRGRFSRTV
ncbi:Oxygen-independent coproporphyrinogen-III oxidase [compost metagenome]